MHRVTILLVTALLLTTGVTLVAAPTATASACDPNFPGGDVTCAVYDDVNRLCAKKFGGPCFE